MRKQLTLLLLLLLCSTASWAETYYTYLGAGTEGPWDNSIATKRTWTTDPTGTTLLGTLTAAPASNDALVILNGYTVNLTANVSTTGHAITIQSGGVLNQAGFQFNANNPGITLSGNGLLRLRTANFPKSSASAFASAGSLTVEYYDMVTTASLPAITTYKNLLLTNSTGSSTVSLPNNNALTVTGTLTTSRTNTATLTFAAGANALTLNGDVTFGAGTTLTTSGAISTAGNITNNGTIAGVDITSKGKTTTTYGDITFTGTANRTFAANGSTMFRTITVNKGTTQQYIQSITSSAPGNFSLDMNYAGYIVNLVNGTLKLGANITLARLRDDPTGQDGYVIPATAGLWIAGADVTLPGNTGGNNKGVGGGLICQGVFRISAGSFTSLRNDGAVVGDIGSYIIEGGTVTVEKFSPRKVGTPIASFVMTGGEFNVRGTGAVIDRQKTFDRFCLDEPTNNFSMSGGTINIYNAEGNKGVNIKAAVGNYSVTGGDFNIILPPANDPYNGTVNISSTVPFWNLTISEPVAAVATTNATALTPITVLNNFKVQGGANNATFNANNNALTVQGNFTLGAPGATATYLPGTNLTSFTGSKDQTLQIDGTVGTAGTLGFHQLLMDKTNGTLTLGGTGTTSMVVRDMLTLTKGVFNDAGNVLTALGNVSNSATHTSSGTTTGSITLAGTTLQTISGNGAGIFGNLVLNNTTGAAGGIAVATSAEQTVSGKLTLNQARLFNIGTNRLYITSISNDAIAAGAGGFSNTRMILTAGKQSDGGIRKTYGTLTPFVFPVGTQVGGTSYYTPASITLTAAPLKYGKINVAPVAAINPFTTTTNALKYYWKVAEYDFSGLPANKVTHQFTAPNALAPASNILTAYVAAYYNPATVTWNTTGLVNDVVENTSSIDINFAAVNIGGEYTAGYPAAFGEIKKFYSIANGNWFDIATWSHESHTGAAITTAGDLPKAGTPVFIGNNNTVTVASNNAASGSLQIDKGAVLDLGTTTGHFFGSLPEEAVQGSGTLRLASATFPGGDFANFLGAQGGTVEYYGGTYTLPINSTPSYYNLVLNPNANATRTLPNQNLRIYGNLSAGTLATAIGTSLLSAATNGNLTVDGDISVERGSLLYSTVARAVAVGGNVTVGTGATFGITTGAATNTLQIGGSVFNNGTFALAPATSGKIDVTFTGAANAKITGTGTTTSFNKLTVNKGTSRTSVLTLDVAGTLTVPTTDNWLVLTNGTFEFAKPSTTIAVNNGAYTIGNTAGLTVNGSGAVINLAATATTQLDGQLSALAGTINVGQSIEYSGATQPEIIVTSGTLNVAGQIRRPTTTTQGSLIYNQTGGAVKVSGTTFDASRAMFEVLNSGSFTMEGGTLTVLKTLGTAAVADVYLHPATSTVSGGEIILGTSGIAAANILKLDTTVPLYSLKVDNGTNTGQLLQNPLTLKGNLTIGNTSSVFDANSLDVAVAGNFTNNNTVANPSIATGGYRVQSATQTTTFNGTLDNQTFTGFPANATAFSNVVVNNTYANGKLTLGTNSALLVNGQLTLTKGELADGGNTITVKGNVVNSAKHSGAGKIQLSGAAAQTVGGNGSGIFGNLELNNAVGATTLANQQVDGVLTLTNGNLTIGSNLLKLTNTAVGAIAGGTFSASKMIITNGSVADGGVQKHFPASTLARFTFPIGVAGKYTPASYDVNQNSIAGTITVAPVNTVHPSTTDNTNTTELKYYWRVSRTGFSAGAGLAIRHVYQYVGADATTAGSYVAGRFLVNKWEPTGGISGTVLTNSNQIALANTTLNTTVNYIEGDYTAGATSEFGAVAVYYSRNAAANVYTTGATWNDVNTWTLTADGTGAAVSTVPTAGTPVVILPNHVVKTTANSMASSSLTLDGTLDISSFTANNFGVVTGTGRLKINSSTFPAGNYDAFTSSTGGTVEYTGLIVTLPPRSVYNNLVFSGSGTAATKSLGNVSLQLNGYLRVEAANTVNNNDNIDVTLLNPAVAFENFGTINLGNGALSVAGPVNNNPGASLTLGDGNATIGTTLTNAGTFTSNNGNVTIGTSLTNAGTYNTGAGMLAVGTALVNSGSFDAAGEDGAINVGTDLTTSGVFQAGDGNISVAGNFTNSGTYTANANVLNIEGDFINLTTAARGATQASQAAAVALFNAGTGTINLQGNFTNSGTFNADQGQVNFLSAQARTLGGTQATTFYNVAKSGAGSLTMAQNATVSNLLSLNSGNIVTGTNTLRLTNTAAQPVVGESLSAYILGKLAIVFPTTVFTARTFPVGNFKPGDTSIEFYRPVTIVAEGGSTTGTEILVEMVQTSPTGKVADNSGISNLSRVRYYRITSVAGSITNPTVRLSFNTNREDEEIDVPSNLRIATASSESGTWTNAGGAGVFSPAAPAGYVTSSSATTVIDGSSLFALASTNIVDNPLNNEYTPLPVELVSFTAKPVGASVQLNWATASEKNSSHFVVERSLNGRDFTAVAQVGAQGTTTNRHTYDAVDSRPFQGLSYYRLRQVDLDGRMYFSNTITVTVSGTAKAAMQAYPNPASGNGFQLLVVGVRGTGVLRVTDSFGRTVQQQAVSLTQDRQDIQVAPSARLAAGMYLVTLQTPSGVYTQKLVVK